MASTFVGDGRFVGDGGAALQCLWSQWKWKMIPNCPGRYIVKKNRDIVRLRLADLVASLMLDVVDDETALAGGLSLALTGPVRLLMTTSPVISDVVGVALFPGGGGVITYCKPTGDFVHTLNTHSGLARKLAGLCLIPKPSAVVVSE
ncbi:hypothetical protein SDRG_08499 [Saprolegnia diclina VS20]|uniref:Uncharacterized protein n=1 Tax=Saprolegnia diclina (strain VS20) TaxID=1156394 RepID=T0QGE2_SAPDV|nr:hypothetical protein SDRG_08499 [Saprolegnia diclina VS20]EQC33816.1 hypothetical protein SDRG_08499 [Saprolegnia diclina VS20]|eukprot:XP_008612611.1 hypothetical protein SDRG_08499 [Saprolegnia diclina VS20]